MKINIFEKKKRRCSLALLPEKDLQRNRNDIIRFKRHIRFSKSQRSLIKTRCLGFSFRHYKKQMMMMMNK